MMRKQALRLYLQQKSLFEWPVQLAGLVFGYPEEMYLIYFLSSQHVSFSYLTFNTRHTTNTLPYFRY
jgi:hypothetical protein